MHDSVHPDMETFARIFPLAPFDKLDSSDHDVSHELRLVFQHLIRLADGNPHALLNALEKGFADTPGADFLSGNRSRETHVVERGMEVSTKFLAFMGDDIRGNVREIPAKLAARVLQKQEERKRERRVQRTTPAPVVALELKPRASAAKARAGIKDAVREEKEEARFTKSKKRFAPAAAAAAAASVAKPVQKKKAKPAQQAEKPNQTTAADQSATPV